MELKALLLDLDGTLVNTAPDMVGALNRLLEKHDKPKTDSEVASKLVSNGGRALVVHGFGPAECERLGDHGIDELVQEFLAIYKEFVCVDSHVYDGLLETLEYCESSNIRWGVITNKPLELAKDVLSGLGLFERCSILLGGDSLPVRKPDPVPMLHSCMVLNLAPSQCLYVGDHLRDIQAGNAAGMDTAAALWGYIGDTETPDTWQAKYMVRKPTGLLNLVQDLIQHAN